ncbi:MAG: hypothetical protein IV085_07010 [Thiobacillus sp.]|nr:hypothetical protein [Thiobacillus sp.]
MCSGCWGFSSAIDVLRDHYRDRMKTGLALGGLRPGEPEPMTPVARDDILHHWHAVPLRTEQPFNFDDAQLLSISQGCLPLETMRESINRYVDATS